MACNCVTMCRLLLEVHGCKGPNVENCESDAGHAHFAASMLLPPVTASPNPDTRWRSETQTVTYVENRASRRTFQAHAGTPMSSQSSRELPGHAVNADKATFNSKQTSKTMHGCNVGPVSSLPTQCLPEWPQKATSSSLVLLGAPRMSFGRKGEIQTT